jgi:2-amino-4-hydroxy-6-hydroxymethyldihydropteridine diphosphokinase
MGEVDQPDFVNAVLEIYTSMTPLDLLTTCKDIEREMGREESERWGPRLIDIDILTYGDEVVQNEELTIPHLGLHQRSFVLYPLADLDENLEIPGLGPVSQLKAALGSPEISPL